MVTKVVTDKDVDGVTIIINTDNKLACATPSGSGSTAVEIEELSYREFLDSGDIIRPFMSKLWVDNKAYPINKVGRIKGTNWLVFQAEGLLQTQPTPPVTEPEQPPVTTQPDTLTTKTGCPHTITDTGSGYEMDGALTIYHTLHNNSGKVPQSLAFTVNVGSQSREYTVPYPGPSVPYKWTSISDFAYEGQTLLSVSNIKVVFTDGSSVTSNIVSPGCLSLPL